ncbi:tRNA methyltransferase [Ceratobasidium sp. AG-Ba]|nr:tRNA methyltransferase [Ceratobasidium sp. AG-Ba]QRW15016.1 tRNA methyltransferase [Ceratobasidium sp. AG-Ba]
MHETLIRPHDVCNAPMQTVGDVAARLRDIELRKEERRLKQIESSNRDKKRKRPEEPAGEPPGDASKKAKTEGAAEIPEDQVDGWSSAPVLQSGLNPDKPSTKTSSQPKRTPHHPNAIIPPNSDAKRYIVSKPFGEVRGHTSYLTFAMLVPSGLQPNCHPGETMDIVPQNPNSSSNDAHSIDETSTSFDSLIAAIPEEELERMLDRE